jgi:hypothetical protein
MRYLTTGILLFGLLLGSASAQDKSPKAAFFLSLLVPGLGELYSGAKWRAAGFMTSEGLTWLAYFSWRSKGNDLKADFRVFADQHWSESTYFAWQAYNQAQPESQQYFETEHLPAKATDTQQYYELIGKYAQFVYGWDDVTSSFTTINMSIPSPLQQDYETQRNESNKYLKRASTIVGLSVLNRIASAIHASAYVRTHQSSSDASSVWLNLTPIDWRGRSVLELKTKF